MSEYLKQREQRRVERERAVEALRAKASLILTKVARRYMAATKNMRGGRLVQNDLVKMLVVVYRAVRRWRRGEDMDRISRCLREDYPAIDFRSTDYLVVLRASLPKLNPKRCSKWAAAIDAADYHQVRPDDLETFLTNTGGIEGAARERAHLWRTVKKGEWAPRSPLRRKEPEPPFHIPRGPIGSELPRKMRRWVQRIRARSGSPLKRRIN